MSGRHEHRTDDESSFVGDGVRFRRGQAELAAVHGDDGGLAALEQFAEIAPDLIRFVVEFAYGDVYARRPLAPRDRQLLTVAVLGTLGDCTPQLRVHLGGALDTGVTPTEVVEAVLHLIPYVGFPRVLNAMTVVKEVFEARGLVAPPSSGSKPSRHP